jgi:hypothetical protein
MTAFPSDLITVGGKLAEGEIWSHERFQEEASPTFVLVCQTKKRVGDGSSSVIRYV